MADQAIQQPGAVGDAGAVHPVLHGATAARARAEAGCSLKKASHGAPTYFNGVLKCIWLKEMIIATIP